MTGRLVGKTALITGACSGIGHATARLFAREGARLLLADRMAEGLAQTAKLIVGDAGEDIAVGGGLSGTHPFAGGGRR